MFELHRPIERAEIQLVKNIQIRSEGVSLNVLNFGGSNTQDFLLLHGLAGRGSEWKSTADWLKQHGRVIALDQRGHGDSRLGVTDFSRTAYIKDVIQVMEQYCRSSTVLIGQSMGGLNVFLAAAERPELVKSLIVVEATPDPNPTAQKNMQNWLDSWSIPFRDINEARKFFGENTLYSKTFVESLEKDEKGYWPAFHKENMIRSLDDVVTQNYWNEWKSIKCPTLVVGGERSSTSKKTLKEMADSIPEGQYTCIPDAGHDLHLDAPSTWRKAVEKFLKN